MEYEITRIEEKKKGEEISEVFFSLAISENNDRYNYGIWLSPNELKQYIADKKSIDAIV